MTAKSDQKAAQSSTESSTESSSESAAKPDAKKKEGKNIVAGLVVWTVVALVLAGAVGALTWPVWKAPALGYARDRAPAFAKAWFPGEPASASPAPAPASVSAPVSTPVSAPRAETPPPASPAPSAPAPSADAARVATLERALGEQTDEVVRLSARLKTLEQKLERQSAGAGASAGAGLLLLGQVQGALAAGAPYADGLALLKKVTTDADAEPLIRRLAVHADAGVPSRRRLADGFSGISLAVAKAIRRDALAESAAAAGIETPGWLARLWERVSSLVVVRRVGVAAGDDSADALLARAEAALGQGDLDGAAIALGGLGGQAAEAAGPWLRDARARIDVDDAFRALQALFLSRVTK